jgi:hypothetical protein
MKDIVAQTNSFSYIGNPPKLFSWSESLLHVQSLLSMGSPVFNAEERRLWSKWLEMKPRGLQILRNENKLRSALNEVQSLEKTSDWEKFHGDVLWKGCKFRCFISNYLTLFILDPLKLQNRTSECPRQDGDAMDSSEAYIEESTLNYLREWAKVFFLLLGHISGEIPNNPGLTKEDVTHSVDFPGEILLETAQKTWEHHFQVGRRLFLAKGGSFASIMLEKILDQWLEQTKPEQKKPKPKRGLFASLILKKILDQWLKQTKRKPKANHEPKKKPTAPSGKYWDWDWMEQTMNQRMQISEEFDRLRTRLLQHTGRVNLNLMCDKIYFRYVLGLDGLENLPIQSVTII